MENAVLRFANPKHPILFKYSERQAEWQEEKNYKTYICWSLALKNRCFSCSLDVVFFFLLKNFCILQGIAFVIFCDAKFFVCPEDLTSCSECFRT